MAQPGERVWIRHASEVWEPAVVDAPVVVGLRPRVDESEPVAGGGGGAAGEAAVREALPGWMATLGLSLQVGDLPSDGHLRAQSRMIRKGRTTLVYEVEVEHAESGAQVGLSTLTFSLLPAQTELQSRAIWAEEPAPETAFVGPALNQAANQVAGEIADWVG